jgi:hypothetical protein
MMDKRQLESIRRDIRQPVYAVGREVMILSLLAVGDHRRARRLKTLDRVADRLVEQRVERRIGAAACPDRFD